MKKLIYFPILYLVKVSRTFRYQLLNGLIKLRDILAEESVETKEMFEIYLQYSLKKERKEDLSKANEQFRDLLKGAGLGVFLVLPFAPITIPFIVKLGRSLGVEVLPSSVRKRFNEEDQGSEE